MYVYVSVYVYVCMYGCLYDCLYITCVYICMSGCQYVCVYLYVYMYVYVYVYVYVCIYIMYMCMYMCVCVCVCVLICVCAYLIQYHHDVLETYIWKGFHRWVFLSVNWFTMLCPILASVWATLPSGVCTREVVCRSYLFTYSFERRLHDDRSGRTL